MQPDPRLATCLTLARTRPHPYYAAAAYTLAQQCGDTAAMEEALALGAASYRRSPCIYARTEATVMQRRLFDEAA